MKTYSSVRNSVPNLWLDPGFLIASCELRGWMYYLLRHCLYSKNARSDLSTVLPLTETSGGKPPCLAHSAHVLLSRTEQLSASPSFPVCHALPNETWLAVSLPLQAGPHMRISKEILKPSCILNLLLICFSPLWFAFVPSIYFSNCLKHEQAWTNMMLFCNCISIIKHHC